MLSAQAYSFRLKSRLAISLSWIAGYTNVIALITCGQVVSHQTGNSTHLALAITGIFMREPRAVDNSCYFGFLVGLFFLGAIASAFMTEGARRLGQSSKYILPMGAEGALLAFFMLALLIHRHPGDSWRSLYLISGIAAFAMGLQNATITKISGAVVRTTHLTGVVTDLGLEGVQLFLWWRDKMRSARAWRYGRVLKVSRRHPSMLRVLLLASIFGSFMLGAMLGTFGFVKWGPIALVAPVLFLFWIVIHDYTKPIADVREIDPTADKELSALFGSLKSVLPAHVGLFRMAHHRAGRLHRAPDFTSWADRIPRHWRIVILVISPLTQFDIDTAAGLLAAVQRLQGEQRRLIISGMNRAQFKTLVDCGLGDVIDLDHFVPDLEFAVASAMNWAAQLQAVEE